MWTGVKIRDPGSVKGEKAKTCVKGTAWGHKPGTRGKSTKKQINERLPLPPRAGQVGAHITAVDLSLKTLSKENI